MTILAIANLKNNSGIDGGHERVKINEQQENLLILNVNGLSFLPPDIKGFRSTSIAADS